MIKNEIVWITYHNKNREKIYITTSDKLRSIYRLYKIRIKNKTKVFIGKQSENPLELEEYIEW